MPRARTSLTFTPNSHDCTPLPCTDRNNLANLIQALRFTDADNGLEDGMSCDLARNPKYALLCGDMYQEYLDLENALQSASAQTEILLAIMCFFVVVIICLAINTIRLTRKVNELNLVKKGPNQVEMMRSESKIE